MKHTSHSRADRLLSSLFYFFSIFMLIALPGHLHSQWVPQSIPVNKPILGIEFANENTGWAISYNTSTSDTAYIIHTTNGGVDWHIQFRGNVGLYCIDVLGDNICYAGGADTSGFALFLRTTNGGLNWESIIVSNILIMTEMFFVNENAGYACDGFFGGVKLTTNGGISWTDRSSGLHISMPRALYFLNQDTGYCGGSFKIFKTVNAGVNWFELFQFGEDVMDIQFNSEHLGWVALTNNKVGITNNGGLSWTYSNPATIGGGTVHSVFFVNDSIGWCGTRTQRIFKSTNGGYNWITQIDSSASYSIHFKDELTGWSADYGISKTTNGGLTYIGGLSNETPGTFELYQNHPNPFNSSTVIRFTIKQSSEAEIAVFDMLGRQVFKWPGEGILQAGTYEYSFTGDNLSSGVYIYRLTAKTSEGNMVFSDSRKMIYLK
ncbi:MAG: T9SS type A sorting domain-containing protein [Ignavibacteria bacterium]|nr:T9SS type A sorting domain-containing protein [Ignavibacteria bacterium]